MRVKCVSVVLVFMLIPPAWGASCYVDDDGASRAKIGNEAVKGHTVVDNCCSLAFDRPVHLCVYDSDNGASCAPYPSSNDSGFKAVCGTAGSESRNAVLKALGSLMEVAELAPSYRPGGSHAGADTKRIPGFPDDLVLPSPGTWHLRVPSDLSVGAKFEVRDSNGWRRYDASAGSVLTVEFPADSLRPGERYEWRIVGPAGGNVVIARANFDVAEANVITALQKIAAQSTDSRSATLNKSAYLIKNDMRFAAQQILAAEGL